MGMGGACEAFAFVLNLVRLQLENADRTMAATTKAYRTMQRFEVYYLLSLENGALYPLYPLSRLEDEHDLDDLCIHDIDYDELE